MVGADYRAFPPRRPEQPIFYPVLNEAHATQIVRERTVRGSGSGGGTRGLQRPFDRTDWTHRRVSPWAL